MSAVKQLNEAMNHFHLGTEAIPLGKKDAETLSDTMRSSRSVNHPALWTLPEIDKFAFSLDHIIKANPQLTEIRTAQSLLFHLTGKVHLAREALK